MSVEPEWKRFISFWKEKISRWGVLKIYKNFKKSETTKYGLEWNFAINRNLNVQNISKKMIFECGLLQQKILSNFERWTKKKLVQSAKIFNFELKKPLRTTEKRRQILLKKTSFKINQLNLNYIRSDFLCVFQRNSNSAYFIPNSTLAYGSSENLQFNAEIA